MKKQYFKPLFEITRFSFENILAVTESNTIPTEEHVEIGGASSDIGGEGDPGF